MARVLTLLHLPPEVRIVIYAFLFDDSIIETTHQVSTSGNVSERLVLPTNASIAFSSRLLYQECIDVFWRQVHVSLINCPPFSEFALCRKAMPYQWTSLRSLYISLGTAGDDSSPYHRPLIDFLDGCPSSCAIYLVSTVRPGDSWNVARLLPFDTVIRFYGVWRDLENQSCGGQQRCSLVVVPTGFHLMVDQIRHWLRGWRENAGIIDRFTVEASSRSTKDVVKSVGGATEAALTFTVQRIVSDVEMTKQDHSLPDAGQHGL